MRSWAVCGSGPTPSDRKSINKRSQRCQNKSPPTFSQRIERLERELDELKLAEKNKKTEIRKHMKALAILNGGQDNQATQTKEEGDG